MGISSSDVVPFTHARANLSELADQVKAGAEKIITKNGECDVALIDARRLDDFHRLECERIHLPLIDRRCAARARRHHRRAHLGSGCRHRPPAAQPRVAKGRLEGRRGCKEAWLKRRFGSG